MSVPPTVPPAGRADAPGDPDATAVVAALRAFLDWGDLSCVLCDRGAARPIAVDLPVAFGASAFVGVVRTARAASGTLAPIRTLLAGLAPDDAPVIDARSFGGAVFGGRLARRATARGAAGVLVLGRVRDVATLETGVLSVRAMGIAPHRSETRDPGAEGAPLQVGRTVVRPGQVLVVDRNGAAVVPRSAFADVVERIEPWVAQERAADQEVIS